MKEKRDGGAPKYAHDLLDAHWGTIASMFAREPLRSLLGGVPPVASTSPGGGGQGGRHLGCSEPAAQTDCRSGVAGVA
jgi:hypothetical protein